MSKIRRRVTVSFNGAMEECMKDIGRMENNMEKES